MDGICETSRITAKMIVFEILSQVLIGSLEPSYTAVRGDLFRMTTAIDISSPDKQLLVVVHFNKESVRVYSNGIDEFEVSYSDPDVISKIMSYIRRRPWPRNHSVDIALRTQEIPSSKSGAQPAAENDVSGPITAGGAIKAIHHSV